jgi:hypothetical protein
VRVIRATWHVLRQRPDIAAIPQIAQDRRQRVALAPHDAQCLRELGLHDEQALVADAGVVVLNDELAACLLGFVALGLGARLARRGGRVAHRPHHTFPAGQATDDPAVGPVGICALEYLPNAAPRRSLTPLRRLSDDQGVQVRPVEVALHVDAGAAPDGIAEPDEKGNQQCGGISLGMRADNADELAGQSVMCGRCQRCRPIRG